MPDRVVPSHCRGLVKRNDIAANVLWPTPPWLQGRGRSGDVLVEEAQPTRLRRFSGMLQSIQQLNAFVGRQCGHELNEGVLRALVERFNDV